MRAATTVFFSLAAALAAAQGSPPIVGPNAFNIPEGQSSYVVTAGGTVDLSWSNQQGSSVTIKLQPPGYTTDTSGLTLASAIPNTGSATVTIPAGADIPAGAYTFEIINNEDTSQINFAPPFSIASASGTGSFGTAKPTGSASTSGSSASASSAAATTTTGSITTTRSSAAVSSTSAAASTTRSSASTTSQAAATTAAPNSNAGAKVQAPLAAAMLLGAAAFL